MASKIFKVSTAGRAAAQKGARQQAEKEEQEKVDQEPRRLFHLATEACNDRQVMEGNSPEASISSFSSGSKPEAESLRIANNEVEASMEESEIRRRQPQHAENDITIELFEETDSNSNWSSNKPGASGSKVSDYKPIISLYLWSDPIDIPWILICNRAFQAAKSYMPIKKSKI